MRRSSNRPEISIIIPCLNEEEYIQRLLEDLSEQDFDNFEVIVVDSASSDNTAEVAEHQASVLPLWVVRLQKRGVSRARNAGAQKAQGNWLLFLDGDVHITEATFLRRLYDTAQRNDAQYGTSSIRTDSWHPFDRIFYLLSTRFFRKTFRGNEPLMTGAVMLVSARLHHEVNGFDETIQIGEDLDYAQRIASYSNKGVFAPGHVFISNRKFLHRGRIRALLIAAGWKNLTPDWIDRWANKDYFSRHERTPLWRSIIRAAIYILLTIVLLMGIYVLMSD
ncbi:hypothetical protein BRC21_01930 [Candidatus Saccharibacteria bacterium SW_7_54_9]|nr:MAG: hypothetical protein BRC21_01930 [Candidatus Saccharibacteria bacterium SW_7_54_9]